MDVLESIDTNKSVCLRKCIICSCCYFLKIDFKFQPKVCCCCHDTTQKSINFNDFAIVTLKGNNYKTNVCFIAKSESVDRMKKSCLSQKRYLLHIFIIMMSNNISETMTEQQIYSKNKETYLKIYSRHYEKNKDRLQKMARYRC